jgi:hypothetical protein
MAGPDLFHPPVDVEDFFSDAPGPQAIDQNHAFIRVSGAFQVIGHTFDSATHGRTDPCRLTAPRRTIGR